MRQPWRVTDAQTGLEWEEKDASGGLHDRDNRYTWSQDRTGLPFGTVFTDFLAQLNDCAADPVHGAFAGHCDWRLASAHELQSLYLARPDPEPRWAFEEQCAPGCVIPTCSCTADDYSWTTSEVQDLESVIWAINGAGDSHQVPKYLTLPVRVVRDLTP